MLHGGSKKILFKVLLTTPYASFETKFDHQKYSEPIKFSQPWLNDIQAWRRWRQIQTTMNLTAFAWKAENQKQIVLICPLYGE